MGERITAASLSKAAGVQLQVEHSSQQHNTTTTSATPPTLAAERVLTGQLLTQPGPWDAGLIAVRVNRHSSSDDDGDGDGDCEDSSSSSSSDGSDDDGGPADTQPRHLSTPDDCLEMNGQPKQAQQQEQQGKQLEQQQMEQEQQQDSEQQEPRQSGAVGGDTATASRGEGQGAPDDAQPSLVCVEFVAAFTAPSFAVGYLAHNSKRVVLSEVQVLRTTTTTSCRHHHPEPHGNDDGGGVDTNTGLDAAAAAAGGDDDDMRPSVTCMEVCCSWPLPPAPAAG